jgi:hypothetical protein
MFLLADLLIAATAMDGRAGRGGGGVDCGSGTVGRQLRAAVVWWPCDEERMERIARQNHGARVVNVYTTLL